jgi:hypothetical protein
MESMLVEEVADDVGGAKNDAAPAEGGRGGGGEAKIHKRNPSRVRFAN